MRYVILFLAFAAAAYGQGGTLSGVVFDKRLDEPLAGAHVVITDLVIGTQTDSTGQSIIGDIPPGEYEVRFGSIGCQERVVTIVIEADERYELDVELADCGGCVTERIIISSGAPSSASSPQSIVILRQNDPIMRLFGLGNQ